MTERPATSQRGDRFFRGDGASIRVRDEDGSLLVAECFGDKSRFEMADRIVDLLNDAEGRTLARCRRCSECPGSGHHWMWSGHEGGMPGADPNDDDGDEHYLIMECKHCHAIRKATDEDSGLDEDAGSDDAA